MFRHDVVALSSATREKAPEGIERSGRLTGLGSTLKPHATRLCTREPLIPLTGPFIFIHSFFPSVTLRSLPFENETSDILETEKNCDACPLSIEMLQEAHPFPPPTHSPHANSKNFRRGFWQMGPIGPAQFIPTLHEDGSIETLRGLVQRLVERLQWRSNQGDLLFPSAYSGREEYSPVLSRNGGSAPTESAPTDSAPADSVGTKSAATESVKSAATESVINESVAAIAAKGFSDDETDSALCLPDAILARAILGPAGATVALASTARQNRRRRASEHGGGGGGGGGGIDDERWRREVRALETGEGGTITVAEGAVAAERVLREIKAWEARGRGAIAAILFQAGLVTGHA